MSYGSCSTRPIDVINKIALGSNGELEICISSMNFDTINTIYVKWRNRNMLLSRLKKKTDKEKIKQMRCLINTLYWQYKSDSELMRKQILELCMENEELKRKKSIYDIKNNLIKSCAFPSSIGGMLHERDTYTCSTGSSLSVESGNTMDDDCASAGYQADQSRRYCAESGFENMSKQSGNVMQKFGKIRVDFNGKIVSSSQSSLDLEKPMSPPAYKTRPPIPRKISDLDLDESCVSARLTIQRLKEELRLAYKENERLELKIYDMCVDRGLPIDS